MRLNLFLLYFTSVQFILGDQIPPQIADVFSIDLEINIYSHYPDQRVMQLVDLNYDKYRNQIALKILSIGNIEHVIIDFNNSQIFKLGSFENEFGCSSNKCTDDQSELICREELDGLFPQIGAFNLSFSHIFPGLEIFGELPSQPAKYKGIDVWENITVDKWVSVYKNTNTTALWTAANWTNTPIATSWGPVPILAQTMFQLKIGNLIVQTLQQVVPNNYKPREKSIDDLFQPSEGVFCNDWQSTKEFPNKFGANVFQFRSEGIKKDDKFVMWTNEWFDLDNGLVRIDYQSKHENSTVTKILDYKQDATFEITRNGCKVRKGNDLSMEIADSPSVISLLNPLKTVNDFFGHLEYKYVGKRHSTRMSESLAWQGISNDKIGKMELKALWEWYFDKANFDVGKNVPTRRSFKVISVNNNLFIGSKGELNPGDKIVHQIYGFEYSTTENLSEKFDVLSCYDSSQIQHYQFEIKSETKSDDVYVNKVMLKPEFRYKWRQQLAKEAKINLLTVAETKCVIIKNRLFVQFKLLNHHPDLPKPEKQIDRLNEIEKKINNGNFKVEWTEENSPRKWTFAAVPESLTTVIVGKESCLPPTKQIPLPEETTQFRSKGLASGIGVGCFMFGLSSGLTFVYIFRFKLLTYFRK